VSGEKGASGKKVQCGNGQLVQHCFPIFMDHGGKHEGVLRGFWPYPKVQESNYTFPFSKDYKGFGNLKFLVESEFMVSPTGESL